MKAVLQEQGFPKMLRVSEEVVKKSYNKYLPVPFKVGELVKVVPFKEQNSVVEGKTKMDFLRQFVKVVRKDNQGNWVLHYDITWDILEPLTKKN